LLPKHLAFTWEMADADAAAVIVDGKVDALQLLRAYTIKGVYLKIRSDNLIFEEGHISRYAPCGFKMGEDLIDIGSVWYMLRGTSGKRSYSQEDAVSHGFVYIGVLHRVELTDYLRGKSETCKGLVPRPPLVPLGVSLDATRPDEPDAKRRKSGDVQKVSQDDVVRVSESSIQEKVLSMARPVKDIDVVLRCPGREVPNADLILKIAKDELKNWHRRPVDRLPDKVPGKVPLYQEIQNMQKDNPDKQIYPIILVPCNKNAPINILNVCDFLQDGEFRPPDYDQVKSFESTRPVEQEITRHICGTKMTFRIKDSTKSFSKSDWLRTVAVIVDGKTWQFKGWPFESHIDLFTTMKGFFFQLPSLDLKQELPTDTISKWKVDVLKVRASRHHDVALRDRFFELLETFLMSGRMKKFRTHVTL